MSFRERLREGKYIAPSGLDIVFYYDTLERVTDRKHAISELINSNESIAQDFGLFSETYDLPVYFIGEDYDLSADSFYQMLSEKYSQENPGYLIHPRWGNIPVIPITFKQSENFVSNAQIAKFEVVLKKVWPSQYPVLAENQGAEIVSLIEAHQITDTHQPDFISQLNVNRETAPNIANKLGQTFTIVKNSMLSIFDGVGDAAQETIDSLLDNENNMSGYIDDIGSNLYNALSTIQKSMRLPNEITSTLKQKIAGYTDMIADIISLLPDDNDNDNILKTASLCFAVMALAESNLSIDLQTRTESLYVIDKTQEQLQKVIALSIDHDYISAAYGTVAKLVNMLLLTMYDLRLEKRKVLTIDSNAIELVFNETGNLDSLDEFIANNNMVNDHFLNLPAGTEVVFYG